MPEAKNPQQAQFDKMTRTPIPRLVMGLAVPFMAQFLAERGHAPNTVVVEHNEHILAREAFAQTFLQQGDKLEIVHFVGGG